MRQIPAVIAVSAVAALTLVGCAPAGSAGSAGCSRPDAPDAAALETVTVAGEVGAAPEVDLFTPLRTRTTVYEDVVVGEGTAIADDAQLLVLDLTVINATDGETVFDTPDPDDLTRVLALSDWLAPLPGLADALDCAAEGSRVVVALAPRDIEPAAASALGLAEDDSAVAVVDVRKVYLPRADGANQFVLGTGMPSVVRAPNGRPGIIVPDSAPPSEVRIEVLKRGRGEVVTGDAPVRAHYTGITWADREVFDSTWDAQPQSLTLDTVIDGFALALEGQTVGSQVLVVIPPDAGYGAEQQGGIPPDSTLVFVIDILGIDAVPAG